MENKELIKLMNDVLKPNGFKKKGNWWRLEGEVLVKIVHLQKSQWGNQYYINYGFDFKDLDYDGVAMHIYSGVSSTNMDIYNVLDFEKNFNSDRGLMIARLLNDILLLFSKTNSISDILQNLNQRPNLNDVPLRVKHFLGIPI